jgi:hypothetical protein
MRGARRSGGRELGDLDHNLASQGIERFGGYVGDGLLHFLFFVAMIPRMSDMATCFIRSLLREKDTA